MPSSSSVILSETPLVLPCGNHNINHCTSTTHGRNKVDANALLIPRFIDRNHVPWGIISGCSFLSAIILLITRIYLARENNLRDSENQDSVYDDAVIVMEDGSNEKEKEKKVDKVCIPSLTYRDVVDGTEQKDHIFCEGILGLDGQAKPRFQVCLVIRRQSVRLSWVEDRAATGLRIDHFLGCYGLLGVNIICFPGSWLCTKKKILSFLPCIVPGKPITSTIIQYITLRTTLQERRNLHRLPYSRRVPLLKLIRHPVCLNRRIRTLGPGSIRSTRRRFSASSLVR